MDIVSQNKEFFRTYPNIQKALLKVPKLSRGYWYDASFLDGSLFLFEMTISYQNRHGTLTFDQRRS